MQVVSPGTRLPSKLMDNDEFYDFCVAHPDQRFERTAEGEIVTVPPSGWESDQQNVEVIADLRDWAKRDGRGKAFGPTSQYFLSTGAAYSPDASWVSKTRIASVPAERRRKFPSVCPEFVIEVMSPTDRLPAAKRKMEEYMRAGVDLGWLIHGDKQTVYICRTGQKGPEIRTGILELSGEGPIAGFTLDLRPIWAGL